MTDSKPKFIFLKMIGCGHCVQFFQNPTAETSVWAKLIRDSELNSKVSFVLQEWGIKRSADGKIENHALPNEYKFINYGPAFYMHSSHTAEGGLEMEKVPRTYEAMKKWILANVGKYQTKNAPKPSKKAQPSKQAQPSKNRGQVNQAEPRSQRQRNKINQAGETFNTPKGRQVPAHLQNRLDEQKGSSQHILFPPNVNAYKPVMQNNQTSDTNKAAQKSVQKTAQKSVQKTAQKSVQKTAQRSAKQVSNANKIPDARSQNPPQHPDAQKVANQRSQNSRHAHQKQIVQADDNLQLTGNLDSHVASLGPDQFLGYQESNQSRFRSLNTQSGPIMTKKDIPVAPSKKFIPRNNRNRK